jgi:hypothetical protein
MQVSDHLSLLSQLLFLLFLLCVLLAFLRFGSHCHFAHLDENGQDVKDFNPQQREFESDHRHERESEGIQFDQYGNFSSPHIIYDEEGDIHFLGGDSDEYEEPDSYPSHFQPAFHEGNGPYGSSYNPYVIYDEEGEIHFLGEESDHHNEDDETSSSSGSSSS